MSELKDSLKDLKHEAQKDLEDIKDSDQLEALRNKYLSRKSGLITNVLKQLKDVTEDERREIGAAANQVKTEFIESLKEIQKRLAPDQPTEYFDVTLPGTKYPEGHLHPLTKVSQEVEDIFASMGFNRYEGNELDNEFYSFESLNIPATHPARDMWDTFYVDAKPDQKLGRPLFRPHTSAMQVKIMKDNKPPLSTIIIGRCFRNEATDASHEHTFHQIEGFAVGTDISIANLIDTLRGFLSTLFKAEVKVRLRPSYFPFVEPGFELDFSCLQCQGKGCKVCKNSGWVELLGCGMIHPKVFEYAGYEKGKYTGFAFGVGLDRLTMMRFGINDIRLLQSGDLRFLNQF